MKFRVLQGKHRHSDGKTYHAGEIIESDKDLTQFKFKFERVKETGKIPVSIDVKNVKPGSEIELDTAVENTEKPADPADPAEINFYRPTETKSAAARKGRPRKQ